MAVIGYIRKHSAIAVILVGISLVAFLVGPNLIDWAKNVLGYSSGPGSKREIGVVDGQSVSLAEFEGLTLKNVELTKLNQQKAELTSDEIFDIKNQSWTQRVNDMIMQEEYSKLGLTVSEDEMIDLLRGIEPHRLIKQYFVNENGVYDPNLVIGYMQNIDQLSPQERSQWENFKEFIYNDRLSSKYYALMSLGFYYPGALAEMDYYNNSDVYSIRFVGLNYDLISDSLVPEPTDSQKEDLYEEIKHQYNTTKTRDIEYVVYNIQPSEQDLLAIEEETMDIFQEWVGSSNPGEYVNNIPGNRYDSIWYEGGELSVMIDSIMFAEDAGTFIEPYREGSSWYMARLMEKDVRPDSASAEHVLIAYQGAFRVNPEITRSKEEAEQLADSIYNVLRRDVSKLEELAVAMSDDGSVVNNNGNIGWFRDGQMVHNFNDAAINGNVGDVVLVETMFGFHIIHITELTDAAERVRVAMIEVPIEYSSETYDSYYAQARRFAGENNTKEKFDQAVIDEGLEKREAKYLREMQKDLPTLENTRQIVRWAFWDEREPGDVSPLFDIGGKILVVSYVRGTEEEGDISMEQIEDHVNMLALNENKARYYQDKINELGTDDIYAIAQTFNVEVDTINSISFGSRNLPGYGTENTAFGQFLALNEGENSGVLEGNGAVFVFEMDKITKAPELNEYSAYINQKNTGFQSSVNNNYPYRAIEQNAEIKDFRRYFY